MYPTTDLMTVLTLIGLSFLVACLTMCFQFCMKPRMIFNWYGKWLFSFSNEGTFWDKTHSQFVTIFGLIMNHLVKPLGLCPYCNGIWISIFTYFYFYELNLSILLFIGITWFFIYTLKTYWYKHGEI